LGTGAVGVWVVLVADGAVVVAGGVVVVAAAVGE
jgi:hypothetical protein